MRLTYEMLKKYSLSQLKKKGFTTSQITEKVANFYLKNQRILTINESEGKTLSNALRKLKKGNVSQGKWIYKTEFDTFKEELKLFNKISKNQLKHGISSDKSFTTNVLKDLRSGKLNEWNFHNVVQGYASNPANYEEKSNVDEVKLLIKDSDIFG